MKQKIFGKIKELNGCIQATTIENSFDQIVVFYTLTVELGELLPELESLPTSNQAGYVPGKIESFFNKHNASIALEKHKKFEKDLEFFKKEIGKCQRLSYGHLRAFSDNDCTIPAKPSKSNIYFGDFDGIWTFTIEKFETSSDDVKRKIKGQVYLYIKSFKDSFTLKDSYFK